MLADVWTWVRLPPAPLFLCIPLHSFAFLGKTLLNQRFLFLYLVFLGILFQKSQTLKQTLFLKKVCRILEIYILLFYGII